MISSFWMILHFIAIIIPYKSMRSKRAMPVTPVENRRKLQKIFAYLLEHVEDTTEAETETEREKQRKRVAIF